MFEMDDVSFLHEQVVWGSVILDQMCVKTELLM